MAGLHESIGGGNTEMAVNIDHQMLAARLDADRLAVTAGFHVHAPARAGLIEASTITNPGFESGTSPWTGTTAAIGSYTAQPARSGTRVAWLNGNGSTNTENIAQSVTLPAGCSSYTFSFWLHIDSAETTSSTQYDKLQVQVLNSSGTVLTTLATYSNLNKASGYTQRSFSLASYAGQTVTLRFLGTEDYSLQTSFVVDDTAVNVS